MSGPELARVINSFVYDQKVSDFVAIQALSEVLMSYVVTVKRPEVTWAEQRSFMFQGMGLDFDAMVARAEARRAGA